MTASIIIGELWRSYGKHAVLRGISCSFEAGRVTALVGPNGAGKTTLLRITAGLMRFDSGTVSSCGGLYFGGFDSLPVHGTVSKLRGALGLKSEPSQRRQRIQRLSRGEQQRVGLDIVFDLDRESILLDEPWTALEPDARLELNGRLTREAQSGKVVVCSSHDLDEVARVADEIVFLSEGRAFSKSRAEFSTSMDREALMKHFRRP